jgi:hypothetical protein
MDLEEFVRIFWQRQVPIPERDRYDLSHLQKSNRVRNHNCKEIITLSVHATREERNLCYPNESTISRRLDAVERLPKGKNSESNQGSHS